MGLNTWPPAAGAVLESSGTFRRWSIGDGVESLEAGRLQLGLSFPDHGWNVTSALWLPPQCFPHL